MTISRRYVRRSVFRTKNKKCFLFYVGALPTKGIAGSLLPTETNVATSASRAAEAEQMRSGMHVPGAFCNYSLLGMCKVGGQSCKPNLVECRVPGCVGSFHHMCQVESIWKTDDLAYLCPIHAAEEHQRAVLR
eukprot:11640159-Prorocentrum_lima.AAC.1